LAIEAEPRGKQVAEQTQTRHDNQLTKEVVMFARSVSMRLKPNLKADFNKTLENDILPLLRNRKGFQDEVCLIAPDGTEAVGISLWDSKESATAYQRETYPEVERLLSKVIEGTAQVKTYDVSVSTIQAVRRGTA
jgi:hypothetical protein